MLNCLSSIFLHELYRTLKVLVCGKVSNSCRSTYSFFEEIVRRSPKFFSKTSFFVNFEVRSAMTWLARTQRCSGWCAEPNNFTWSLLFLTHGLLNNLVRMKAILIPEFLFWNSPYIVGCCSPRFCCVTKQYVKFCA